MCTLQQVRLPIRRSHGKTTLQAADDKRHLARHRTALQVMEPVCRSCRRGRKTHEPIVGKDKSRKACLLPKDFCVGYCKVATKHFLSLAKAEFLEGRLMLLENRNGIDKARKKTKWVMRETEDISSHTDHIRSSTAYIRRRIGMRNNLKGTQASVPTRMRRTRLKASAKGRSMSGYRSRRHSAGPKWS